MKKLYRKLGAAVPFLAAFVLAACAMPTTQPVQARPAVKPTVTVRPGPTAVTPVPPGPGAGTPSRNNEKKAVFRVDLQSTESHLAVFTVRVNGNRVHHEHSTRMVWEYTTTVQTGNQLTLQFGPLPGVPVTCFIKVEGQKARYGKGPGECAGLMLAVK